MKKKGWSLVFLGLCLLLALSVSSVAVAGPCKECQKCDQDGDGAIRNTSFCQNKCDAPFEAESQDQPPGMCLVDGDGDGATTFTVEVFFDFSSGFVSRGGPITGVVGTIHGNRHKMGENDMTVNVSQLTPPTDCTPGFGTTDDATFTFHTAQIPKSADDLTFVSPGLGLIVVNEVSYSLRLDGGAIADPTAVPDCDATGPIQPAVDDWFPGPGDTTCFEGNTITWSQNSSPTGAACNAEVQNQPWRIGVTGEPPM